MNDLQNAFTLLDSDSRQEIFNILRAKENESLTPDKYREKVRWPIVQSMVDAVGTHQIPMENGLVLGVSTSSRIEKSFLLSRQNIPDHAWEPQTTRIILEIAERDVLIGGAFFGDHVAPLAFKMQTSNSTGKILAFEPFTKTYADLIRNLEFNSLSNVEPKCQGLWSESGKGLKVGLKAGESALASALVEEMTESNEVVTAAVDDFIETHDLGLIVIDLEGSEEECLKGASKTLQLPTEKAPHLIFEVHREYFDWSDGLENTSILQLILDAGYDAYAIRDIHDNLSMKGRAIELIPIQSVYLEGPPHGFNLLATKDKNLLNRLDAQLVEGVSPKYIPGRDSKLFAPLDGLGLGEVR
tara:strand:+ start:2518 stop:3585 length:1068 start_codon:yes stop_codon:yes gene_type:complete